MFIIVMNTATLALQTTGFNRDACKCRCISLNLTAFMVIIAWYLNFLDAVFTGIYMCEIVLKMVIYKPIGYFKNGWNIFGRYKAIITRNLTM